MREAGIEYTMRSNPSCIGGDNFYKQVRDFNINRSFEAGAIWADDHPKSPWISVNDDLPCNHEEYINTSDKDGTFYVIALVNGFAMLSGMEKFDGKWHWITVEPAYWMPIPELPK